MTQKKAIFSFLLLVLFLAACASSPEVVVYDEALSYAPALEETAGEAVPLATAPAFRTVAESAGQEFSLVQDIPQSRLIIRTADMSIVVKDTEEAMATITQMVEENGGWVVSSSVFQYSENAKTGNMTVRIPAEGFQSALDAIRGMSVEVTRLSTSGQDVTEEFVDLSARLENLEATAERVRAFLDEAETVEEALAVNQELSRLEGEIEAMKGRLQYLEQSAAFSTISIDLTPDELSQPIEVGGWQPQGVIRNAIEALISALQALVNVLIWLVIFLLPILLIITIPLWLIVWVIRRRRVRRKEGEETD